MIVARFVKGCNGLNEPAVTAPRSKPHGSGKCRVRLQRGRLTVIFNLGSPRKWTRLSGNWHHCPMLIELPLAAEQAWFCDLVPGSRRLDHFLSASYWNLIVATSSGAAPLSRKSHEQIPAGSHKITVSLPSSQSVRVHFAVRIPRHLLERHGDLPVLQVSQTVTTGAPAAATAIRTAVTLHGV